MSRENQLFEAELRRQTQAANELRMWRRSNLLEQRKTHEEQMTAAHEQEKTANANMREPMPGYINSRKFVDDGRQKILEPHQQMLHKTLHSQVESRKVRTPPPPGPHALADGTRCNPQVAVVLSHTRTCPLPKETCLRIRGCANRCGRRRRRRRWWSTSSCRTSCS